MAGLIGVFGGSFDPPHHGHRILADEARAAFGLERVLWVVTAQPPHKQDLTLSPPDVRAALVQAALGGDEGFELSRADLDRPPPHFAVGTLDWLQTHNPGARWAYLMGSDSLRDLPTWHDPRGLLARCAFLAVMRRPGVEIDLEALEQAVPGLRAKARFFEAPWVGISGREIRERVRSGRPYRSLVPRAVATLIGEQQLYR